MDPDVNKAALKYGYSPEEFRPFRAGFFGGLQGNYDNSSIAMDLLPGNSIPWQAQVLTLYFLTTFKQIIKALFISTFASIGTIFFAIQYLQVA